MTIGSDRIPYRCFLKWVGRWSPRERMLRLCRLVWRRGEPGRPGGGYSAKLSLAVVPSLFRFTTEFHGWAVTLLGLRVHYQRSYGGWIV